MSCSPNRSEGVFVIEEETGPTKANSYSLLLVDTRLDGQRASSWGIEQTCTESVLFSSTEHRGDLMIDGS